MNDHPKYCSEGWVEAAFGSAWRAFALLFVVMALILGAYLGIHLARPKPEVPWGTAVRLPDDGRFQPRFQVAVLERFFSEKELIRLKDIIGKRCEEARSETLASRRPLLTEIQNFRISHWHGGNLPERPSIRGRSGFNNAEDVSAPRVGINPGPGSGLGSGAVLPLSRAAEWNDAEVLSQSLTNVIESFRIELVNVSAETRERGSVLLNRLLKQDADEITLRAEIEREIRALEPPLNFLWLYHEGSGWVFEVVVWTLLGVLANAVISIILACKDGQYQPSLFAYVIPKFFLAPLISVVFVALWAAGITQSNVTSLNLPWFMAFSFFLGFTTENLYARVRKFADALLGGATEPSGATPGGPGRDYHMWRHPRVDPKDVLTSATLPQLREALTLVAQGEMEHAMVTKSVK